MFALVGGIFIAVVLIDALRHAVAAAESAGQGRLFDTYRRPAFVTNSTLTTIEADARHRDHAIVEQVVAELKGGPLVHLPSGKYAAWLSHTVIAFNLNTVQLANKHVAFRRLIHCRVCGLISDHRLDGGLCFGQG